MRKIPAQRVLELMSEARAQCFECRYPMLKLADYDGDCSLDAPGFDRTDARDFSVGMRQWALVYAIALDLSSGVRDLFRNMLRKRKVRRLREEILPEWPLTLVCPHCLSLRKER